MATHPDVEIIDPRFQPMVLPNAPLELLGDGFRWLEGPVWFADQDCLLFSDLPNDRIMRWTQAGASARSGSRPVSPTGTHETGRADWSGARTIDGVLRGPNLTGPNRAGRSLRRQRLNSPNDVIVRSDDTHLVLGPTLWYPDRL